MGLLTRKKAKIDKEEKETKVEKVEEVKPAVVSDSTQKSVSSLKVNSLIVRPLVTEKSAVAQSLNKYSFMVDKRASKTQIKKAIKEIFGVEPAGVNIMNIEGKIKRFGRTKGRRQDYKKAIITLPKGKSISVHEGV